MERQPGGLHDRSACGAGKRARPHLPGRARSAPGRRLPPVRRPGGADRSRDALAGLGGGALARRWVRGLRAGTALAPLPGHAIAARCARPYAATGRRDGGAPGPRDDMFAVGVLAHEMLTGQPPAPEAEPLEEVRSVPPGVAELVHRCLAAEPAGRWADAGAALASVNLPGGGAV